MVGLRLVVQSLTTRTSPNRLRAPKLTCSSSRLYGTVSNILAQTIKIKVGLSAPTNRIKTDVRTAHLTNLSNKKYGCANDIRFDP